MGYDLLGHDRDFYANCYTYRRLLGCGYIYGWRPCGTELTEQFYRDMHGLGDEKLDWEWDGDYFCNEMQRVTDEDARALADAMERVLAEVPVDVVVGRSSTISGVTKAELAQCRSVIIVENDAHMPDGTVIGRWEYESRPTKEFLDRDSALAFFSGAGGRNYLRKFIEFARAGEFRIS